MAQSHVTPPAAPSPTGERWAFQHRRALLVALSLVVLGTLPVTLALLATGAPAPLLFSWVVVMDIGLKVALLWIAWGPMRTLRTPR